MRFIVYIVLHCAILLTGCWSNPFINWDEHSNDPNNKYRSGFIAQYHTINDKVIIHKRVNSSGYVIDFSTYRDNLDTFIADYFGGERYHQIKTKYGDTKDRWEWCDPNDIAYSESISSIDIITHNDWDTTHPAGSNINDIFDIRYATYKYYVDSGFDDTSFDSYSREVWEERRASELKEGDMWFIHTSFQLICKHKHDSNEIHPISVVLNLDSGREQIYNINVNYHN